MEKTLNFLFDCFQNLSNKYHYAIFVHENNWDIFKKYFIKNMPIDFDSFKENKESFFITHKDSFLGIFKVPRNDTRLRGARSQFCFYDDSIDKNFLYEVIFPCVISSPALKIPFCVQKLSNKN